MGSRVSIGHLGPLRTHDPLKPPMGTTRHLLGVYKFGCNKVPFSIRSQCTTPHHKRVTTQARRKLSRELDGAKAKSKLIT